MEDLKRQSFPAARRAARQNPRLRLGYDSEWSAESAMPLNAHRRRLLVRALIVPSRQEHGGAQVNRISPELGKHLALNLPSFNPLRVRRDFHSRQLSRQA